MERNPSYGSVKMPKQSSRDHSKADIICSHHQIVRQLRERQKEGEEREPQGQLDYGSGEKDR